MTVPPTKRNRFAVYIIAVTLPFGLAFAVSCRKGRSHSSMGAMHPPPQASAPNGVAARTYHGVGVVERVDPNTNAITINHEEIKGYMPAMSMEYHPRDRTLLDAVKSGDHIEFTLEDAAGIATVTEIKRH